MIATVTLNPSIDRELRLADFDIGGVNRAQLTNLDPGGKGVNVSRALTSYGVPTFAILVGGELGGRWFDERLTQAQVPHEVVMATGVTRSNLTIVEANGTVTKINENGFAITDEILNEVRAALARLNLRDHWVVFAGRLNQGAASDTYRDLAQYARSLGARVAIDASDKELRDSLWDDGPDLIKPNQHELASIVGRDLATIEAVIEAAREVLATGVKLIVCSLGADGALYISKDVVVHAEPRHPVSGVPVGAGDILLATFLAGGATPQALAGAVAWSAASVKLPGTAIPTPAQAAEIDVVVHTAVDTGRTLVEVA